MVLAKLELIKDYFFGRSQDTRLRGLISPNFHK